MGGKHSKEQRKQQLVFLCFEWDGKERREEESKREGREKREERIMGGKVAGKRKWNMSKDRGTERREFWKKEERKRKNERLELG